MNVSWSQTWRIGLALLLLGGWAVAGFLGSAGIGSVDLNAAVAVTPLLVAWGVVLWQFRSSGIRMTGWLLALGMVFALWPQLRQNISLLYYLEHQGSHFALAILFGRTLWGPADPLITSMAHYIYGDTLSERKVRYTRQVTAAWAVYFVSNALVSTGLYLWAPTVVWSVHANLLTGPLIALMFLGEYFVRKWMLPPHERPGLGDIIRAYRRRADHGLAKPGCPESGT